MASNPPKLFLKFFRWYCHPRLVKPIEGDLTELYREHFEKFGKRKADLLFAREVLVLFRRNIIKPAGGTYRLNTYGMLKNYFKISFRNLKKQKRYSFINISGLASGFAIVLLISFWVTDELTFDTYHLHYDRIVQVMQKRTITGDTRTQESVPMPLGDELRQVYGKDFESVVMSTRHRDYTLLTNFKSIVKEGGFMEPDAAKMFSLQMTMGSWNELKNPNAIFLSASTYDALFGDENGMGEIVKINDRLNMIVMGVYEDLPYNTRFHNLSFIGSWDGYISSSPQLREAREHPNWRNASHLLFAQLSGTADLDNVNKKIALVKYHKLPEENRGFNPKIFLHPMKDWRLRSHWVNGEKTGGFITYVWLFGIAGTFILILACINFMSLSTANSQHRAKEVGVRKAMGSRRRQLIDQFLCESFIIVLISFVVAILIVLLALPFFNHLADKQISFDLLGWNFWLLSLIFLIVISLLAGSYPAFYLSSFQPTSVLKSTFKAKFSSGTFRKALVIIQFTTSIILFISTLGVEKQVNFAKNRPLGYSHEKLVSVAMNAPAFYTTHQVLRTELTRNNLIEEMALSSSSLTRVSHNAAGYTWEGKDPAFNPQLAHIRVTPSYGATVNWEILEGRDFMNNYASDSLSFIINETAAAQLNIAYPLGKTIRWMDKDFKIIGIVKDMLMESPFDPVKPTIYEINDGTRTGWMTLRLNSAVPMAQALEGIQEIIASSIPNVQAEYLFVDDIHYRKFAQIERVDKLSEIFALLAIFISCLGLFGLATFLAEKRSKEMGIRKVLGASVFKIWQLMSQEFLLLVGISCCLAVPTSYFLLDNWLDSYAYRTEPGTGIFIYSCLSALIIALMTISSQALKTALVNPIKSLKDE